MTINTITLLALDDLSLTKGRERPISRSRLMLQRGAVTVSNKYILPAHVALVGELIRELSNRDSLTLEVTVGTPYTTVKNQVTAAR